MVLWRGVALDPLFWQALGKALGWNKIDAADWQDGVPTWKNQWHRFIDHLAEGKDTTQFWDDLLANPNKKEM